MPTYKSFIVVGFLISVTPAYLFANNVAENAEKHADNCVKACGEYYQKHSKLEGFKFYDRIDDNFLLKMVNEVLSKDLINKAKKMYCNAAAESLLECYKKDSIAYNFCKWVARGAVSYFTKNPKIQGMLGSCKDTCLNDIRDACK